MPVTARIVRLRFRKKKQPFQEHLHPRDGRGRFAEVPGVGLDPLLERIRAASARPTRAPRNQPDFDEEEYGLVFRDGDSERVAKTYKANVVASLTRDLRDIPDDVLLGDDDHRQLTDIQGGHSTAHLDSATGQVRTTGPASPPPNPDWTTITPTPPATYCARRPSTAWSPLGR